MYSVYSIILIILIQTRIAFGEKDGSSEIVRIKMVRMHRIRRMLDLIKMKTIFKKIYSVYSIIFLILIQTRIAISEEGW
jgi:hypothetical protein